MYPYQGAGKGGDMGGWGQPWAYQGQGYGKGGELGGWEAYAYQGGAMGGWEAFPYPGAVNGDGADMGGWQFPYQGYGQVAGGWESSPQQGFEGQGEEEEEQTGRAFQARTFEEEKRFLLEACSQHGGGWAEGRALVNELWCNASPEVRADPEIALACVEAQGGLLRYFDASFLADRQIVLAAVKKNGVTLEEVSRELQGDKEVVLAAVSQDGEALQYASTRLRRDKEVVIAAATSDGYALQYAEGDLDADKEVALAAAKVYPESLKFVSDKLLADKELILAAAKINIGALAEASSELRTDKDFILSVARKTSQPEPHACYSTCYKQVTRSLEPIVSREDFCLAAKSALCQPGQPEPAPTVLVNLTKKSASPEEPEEKFHVEANLALSGEELESFDLPLQSTRLYELAEALVSKLRKVGKEQQRIFIHFLSSDSEDPIVVTPWDCIRSLGEFLSAKP